MYQVVPFLLIIISLSVIIVIIIRKFPQLTLLDVDSLPEVKEEKQKDAFLKKRVEKIHETKKKQHTEKVQKMGKSFSNVQKLFRQYVTDVYHKIEKKSGSETLPSEETPRVFVKKEAGNKVMAMVERARQSFQENKLDLAENQFIAAIRLDKKNMDAYRGLVDVYIKQEQITEAKETIQFLLQLYPQDDWAHMRFVDIALETGDTHVGIEHLRQAIRINDALAERHFLLSDFLRKEQDIPSALAAAQKAVDRESENPRYLDNIIELAIMSSNKKLAEEMFQQLRLVNPENQKLEVFRQKIASL